MDDDKYRMDSLTDVEHDAEKDPLKEKDDFADDDWKGSPVTEEGLRIRFSSIGHGSQMDNPYLRVRGPF